MKFSMFSRRISDSSFILPHLQPFVNMFFVLFQTFSVERYAGAIKNRQRPTFPGSFPPSIIGARELNCCVRDGNRCILSAIVTGLHLLNWTRVPNVYFSKNHWLSVRPISIGQLNTLLHLHLRPINVVVFHGSYLTGEILSCGGLRT